MENTDRANPDLTLISQWAAFNSLYGQWDGRRREPQPDRDCWRRFCGRIPEPDKNSYVELFNSRLRDELLNRL